MLPKKKSITPNPNPNPFGWTLYIILGTPPKANNLPKQETSQITLFIVEIIIIFLILFKKIHVKKSKNVVLKNSKICVKKTSC